MLAVISDDFTGASEIAGIALAKGYSTVIETRSIRRTDADVLVIATDMRSLDPESAARKSAQLTSEVLKLQPDLIFKKVDSVLRGNVGPELEAQMKAEHKDAALLIPANPSRKRTISGGVYFVDGKPVVESGFAQSRDFAFPSSSVVDILMSSGASNASCISLDDPLDTNGLFVGNTGSSEDMAGWVSRVSDRLVPAGAADFFAALLDTRTAAAPLNGADRLLERESRRLYLCGSNFPSSRDSVEEARLRGVCVAAMPDEIYFSEQLDQRELDNWAAEVIVSLVTTNSVIVAAPQVPAEHSLSGSQITKAMAEVARQVVGYDAVSELMIEGGATSQAVMTALNINCLYPTQRIAPGVTRMRVDGYPNLHITMKPGSYRWPDEIWDFT